MPDITGFSLDRLLVLVRHGSTIHAREAMDEIRRRFSELEGKSKSVGTANANTFANFLVTVKQITGGKSDQS